MHTKVRAIDELIKQLELDEYEVKNSKLLISEADILDTTEEIGLIETLYQDLNLDNKENTFHHLQLSDEHYFTNKWDDSISNSRKFLECVLRAVAAYYRKEFWVKILIPIFTLIKKIFVIIWKKRVC